MNALFRDLDGGVAVTVRAKPRSSRPGVELADDAVVVRVKSAPVDGKANKELAETLADALDIPKSRVTLKSGGTSKTKVFFVAGLDSAAARERIGKK